MRAAWLVILVLFAAGVLPARAQETLPSIVVIADNTLGLPLAHIVRDYTRDRHVAVALSLGEGDQVARQIAEGGAADVLITARAGTIKELKQLGLIDVYSETAVAGDRLALVVPEHLMLQASLLQGFPTGPLLLALGQEPVFVLGHPQAFPEAGFAREALRAMKADADLEPYTVYLKDRRQMREAIRRGAAGIMPAADARRHSLHILDLVPENAHFPITYKAVVIAGENMVQARRFTEYLKSPQAQAALVSFGFTTQ